MGGLLLRLKSWWDGADKNQRTITVVGGGFLILLIVATYMFASKPRMGLLASGLAGADQGKVMQELQKEGVPCEIDTEGNVQVPVDRIPELRAKLMAAGMPIEVSHSSDDDFKNLSYMSTPEVERERLKAILEDRLQQTIQTMDGIDSASVHIALADDTAFVGDQHTSSASVTLHEKPGSLISREQARGIALMVASAVPELDVNNVTVLNSEGEPLIDPDDQTSPSSKVAMKLETERAEAKRRERELQAKLDQVFGAGATVASVDLQLDFKTEQYTEVKRTPSKPLVTTDDTETMTGGAAPGLTGGTSGAGANTTGAPATAPGAGTAQPGSRAYQNEHSEKQYVMTERTTQADDPAGRLKSMSISVLVDQDRVKDVKAVQAYLDAYLAPLKTTDPTGFAATVTSTKFDTTAAQAAKDAEGAAASHDKIQQVLSMLPIGALVVVAAMVLKSLGRFARTSTLAITTADGQVIPLPADGLPMPAEMLAQYNEGGARQNNSASNAPVRAQAPQREHDDPITQISRRPHPMEDDDDFDQEVEVAGIKKKVNIPLEQIKKMADKRPEFVATLIKGWLMSDGTAK